MSHVACPVIRQMMVPKAVALCCIRCYKGMDGSGALFGGDDDAGFAPQDDGGGGVGDDAVATPVSRMVATKRK